MASLWDRVGPVRWRKLELGVWRVVEAQHVISTRKLVDSDAEQQVLEELLEPSKPLLGREPELERLHYLLATPFRYPPLRYGSRFGTRAERGIFYASLEQRTAFAETAYYRLLFLEGTTAELPALLLELTAFRAKLATRRGVDLTRPPFAEHRRALVSKTSYRATQPLGSSMREAGAELFLFTSARDASEGTNAGVLAPRAIASRRPAQLQNWLCVVTRQAVELSRKDLLKKQVFAFERQQFLVRGKLPQPGTGG